MVFALCSISTYRAPICSLVAFALLVHCPYARSLASEPWIRHTIDDSLRGADGVRLGDINQDGLPDIVTGWEESGRVRVYFQPPTGDEHANASKRAWPAVTVGKAPSVEDAVFVDLNGNGRLDVLASCEGKEQALHCFLSPPKEEQHDASKWKQLTIANSRNRTRWMFALPSIQNSGRVFLGSKNPNGQVAYLVLPDSDFAIPNRELVIPIHQLAPASWIMSMIERDVDADGDLDLIYSDRKDAQQGVYWLECPDNPAATWQRHAIGGLGHEVMFLSVVDGKSGIEAIFVAAKPNRILKLTPPKLANATHQPWKVTEEFAASLTEFSRAKAVAAGDLDGDGRTDLVYSCESADPPRQGVVLLTAGSPKPNNKWTATGISGPKGIKYDLIELIDLDLDGDLDVLTCEERHAGRGLGVIWYENPVKN